MSSNVSAETKAVHLPKTYGSSDGKSVVACRAWSIEGRCDWGARCRYSHGGGDVDKKQPLQPLPFAIGGPALTADGRFFIRGGQMSDEDRIAEFKEIGQSRIPEQRIAEHANKYIVAFLNSDTGGSLYCGVRDDGTVTGITLNREQRDTVRLSVDAYVARIQPVPGRELYVFDFIPVVERTASSSPLPVADLYVVKFTVQSGWKHSPVYATGDNEPWRRYDASVRPMKVIEIAERARRHVITSASPPTAAAAPVAATIAVPPPPVATAADDVKRAVHKVLSSYRDLGIDGTPLEDRPDAAPLPSNSKPAAAASPLTASTPIPTRRPT